MEEELEFSEVFDKLVVYTNIIYKKYTKLASLEKQNSYLSFEYLQEYDRLTMTLEAEKNLLDRSFQNEDFLEFFKAIYAEPEDFMVEYLEQTFEKDKTTLRIKKRLHHYLYLNDPNYRDLYLKQLSYSARIKWMIELSEDEGDLTSFREPLINFKYMATFLDPFLEDEFTSQKKISDYFECLGNHDKEEISSFVSNKLIYYLNKFLSISDQDILYQKPYFWTYLAFLRIRSFVLSEKECSLELLKNLYASCRQESCQASHELFMCLFDHYIPKDRKVLKRKETSLY